MTEAETEERQVKLRKMDAEISKLLAETAKISSENRWYPFVVGSGFTLAIVAVVKHFL